MIDCRGLGAKPAWPALRGIRGEVARVHAPGIGLTRPVRLLHPRYPLYIAPKENDLYVIGATEVEGEDMSPVSGALGARIAERGVRRASRFRRGAHSRTERRSAARRCPITGRPSSGTARELCACNGLYRHGFMIAPEVADKPPRSAAEALLDAAPSAGTDSVRRFPPPDALGGDASL